MEETFHYNFESGEVSSLVDELATHRNMRIQAAPPNSISTLKRSKTPGLEGLPGIFFLATPAVSVELLFRLIRKFLEFEISSDD